ncbi:conserved hypothetical protein [Trichinella spiralis]|uniref:hypothetical protein n=1 Tax=Trichinella spiralis TaxID=6334 RepID=UPI0001EFE1E9|nr:conserved hypothetical protein [Trichinella spiralis]
MESSIMKYPAKQLAYSTVIEEYIQNGWVEEVTSQHEQNGKTWYLPHHAVYKTVDAHAERNPEECDDIIKRVLSNMYVDDLVMSCDEKSEVAALICRVPAFLRKGGFHLRKWASNRVDLLATLPRPEVCKTGERELGKALGVYWLKDEDVITFRPPANSTTQSRTTKRQLLSLVTKVYDPLGYLATPFTV